MILIAFPHSAHFQAFDFPFQVGIAKKKATELFHSLGGAAARLKFHISKCLGMKAYVHVCIAFGEVQPISLIW